METRVRENRLRLADGETLLTGWGRTSPTTGQVVELASESEVTEQFHASRGVIARGAGRSYGDAAQNAGGRVLVATALDGLCHLDREAGTVAVQAGATIDSLARLLVPQGFFPPVVPGTAYVTVGGAIAADIHGKNHHREGSFGAHVDGMKLATPQGVVDVSPTSDPELFWATVGGMGLTGVILQASIRLKRIESSWMVMDESRASDLGDLMQRLESADSRSYSVAWIDCAAKGANLGRGVVLSGEHATRDEIDGRDATRAFPPPRRIAAPTFIPSGLVSVSTARAFNEVWFRKTRRRGSSRLVPMRSFFFPLDAIDHWNRLYGPRGFIQHQFVVPADSGDTVRAIIESLVMRNCPSVFGVLKRFGSEGKGVLSFPTTGWTLALDIPVGHPDLAQTLDEIDDIVASAGGRIYLAKDSRARAAVVHEMYPRLDAWREVKARVDPDGALVSDLDRRLDLSGISR